MSALLMISSLASFCLAVAVSGWLLIYGPSDWDFSTTSLMMCLSFTFFLFVSIGLMKIEENISATRKREATRQSDVAREARVREHFLSHRDHRQVLRNIRARTVYRDEFGDWQFTAWRDELERYIREKMGPPVLGYDFDANDANLFLIGNFVDQLLDEAESENHEIAADSAVMDTLSGKDYETFCAEELRRSGLQVQATGGPGDQGADIIATSGQLRIVVQCKRKSSPVGNKAVQEAEAARQYYDCARAIVVTNAGFTTSARQLANKLGVLLVSTEELVSLCSSIGQPR